jgi:hypothetical protein
VCSETCRRWSSPHDDGSGTTAGAAAAGPCRFGLALTLPPRSRAADSGLRRGVLTSRCVSKHHPKRMMFSGRPACSIAGWSCSTVPRPDPKRPHLSPVSIRGRDMMGNQPAMPVQLWKSIPAGPAFLVLESKLAPALGRLGIGPGGNLLDHLKPSAAPPVMAIRGAGYGKLDPDRCPGSKDSGLLGPRLQTPAGQWATRTRRRGCTCEGLTPKGPLSRRMMDSWP